MSGGCQAEKQAEEREGGEGRPQQERTEGKVLKHAEDGKKEGGGGGGHLGAGLGAQLEATSWQRVHKQGEGAHARPRRTQPLTDTSLPLGGGRGTHSTKQPNSLPGPGLLRKAAHLLAPLTLQEPGSGGAGILLIL